MLLSNVSVVNAQRRSSTARRGATARTTASAGNAAVIKQNSEKVADKIKTLARFIYLYGGSVSQIQTIEADARSRKLSQDTQQKYEAGKKGLVLTIRNFKVAMSDLENDFRSAPALKPYLLKITGVADLAGVAEDQAAANQYDQSGRTLLDLMNQLTDVLLAMRS